MTSNLPLNLAADLLSASNVIYVVGAVLTLASAAMVLFEKHSENRGIELRWGLKTEIVVVIAALISLAGTFGAIGFGNVVSHLKDVDLDTYKKTAGVKIATANQIGETAKNDAADANQKAENARLKADSIEQENLRLRKGLTQETGLARTAEAGLDKKNKETSDYAHEIALQQQNMAEQAKVSPTLNAEQVTSLANYLRPFTGQSVALHLTLDTVVVRLGSRLEEALIQVGIQPTGTLDAGKAYQGVSVVVHAPRDIPPLANALVLGLRAQGIAVNPASDSSVAAGGVAIYLGPN